MVETGLEDTGLSQEQEVLTRKSGYKPSTVRAAVLSHRGAVPAAPSPLRLPTAELACPYCHSTTG